MGSKQIVYITSEGGCDYRGFVIWEGLGTSAARKGGLCTGGQHPSSRTHANLVIKCSIASCVYVIKFSRFHSVPHPPRHFLLYQSSQKLHLLLSCLFVCDLLSLIRAACRSVIIYRISLREITSLPQPQLTARVVVVGLHGPLPHLRWNTEGPTISEYIFFENLIWV